MHIFALVLFVSFPFIYAFHSFDDDWEGHEKVGITLENRAKDFQDLLSTFEFDTRAQVFACSITYNTISISLTFLRIEKTKIRAIKEKKKPNKNT